MDDDSSKRTTRELELPRNSGLSSRDPNHEERSFQIYSRRRDPMKNSQNNNSDKSKHLKPSFRFDRNYSSAASYSKSFSSIRSIQKSYHEQQNLGSLKETDAAESSTRREDNGDNWKFGFHGREEEALEHHEAPNVRGFSTSSADAPNNSSIASASRYGKQINQKFTSAIQDAASSVPHQSSTPQSAARDSKTISQGISDRPQRYGLRNIGCASISDVLPSGCSSSNGHRKRDVAVRRRLQYGEGSSNTMLSLQEHEASKEASKRTRVHSGREVVRSVGTRRGFSGEGSSRMRQSEQEPQHINPLSIYEVAEENSQRSFPLDRPSTFQDFHFTGRPGSSSRRSRSRLIDHSGDTDDYRRFNMGGITEVLLALERIGQDEVLTYEEEYVVGEEVGRLPCEHLYHVQCIHQWLKLKNWCPVCKAPAASSKNELQFY
ncbi:E3 ubiquitin ligase BIG BROTHER-related [Apostasia shenzhenica]|uniref:RING-type E3 ubiquitin transferase n=1 Tax=Apostasia shenzhenica TaxID=1088818 RepID=A0A2I0APT8_9ASPA|nr:E3 ubiquitin ligase BIG BROTHER-related [Apostasia shenzhenica]